MPQWGVRWLFGRHTYLAHQGSRALPVADQCAVDGGGACLDGCSYPPRGWSFMFGLAPCLILSRGKRAGGSQMTLAWIDRARNTSQCDRTRWYPKWPWLAFWVGPRKAATTKFSSCTDVRPGFRPSQANVHQVATRMEVCRQARSILQILLRVAPFPASKPPASNGQASSRLQSELGPFGEGSFTPQGIKIDAIVRSRDSRRLAGDGCHLREGATSIAGYSYEREGHLINETAARRHWGGPAKPSLFRIGRQ